MSYLSELRELNPGLANVTDEQLAAQLPEIDPELFAGKSTVEALKLAQQDNNFLADLGRAAWSGAKETTGHALTALELATDSNWSVDDGLLASARETYVGIDPLLRQEMESAGFQEESENTATGLLASIAKSSGSMVPYAAAQVGAIGVSPLTGGTSVYATPAAVNAAVIGGGAYHSVRDQINSLSYDELANGELFDSYTKRASKFTQGEEVLLLAKEQMAEDLARDAAADGAWVGGLSGAVLGPALSKMFRGGQGALKGAGTGATAEGTQEFVESGAESYGVQSALSQATGAEVDTGRVIRDAAFGATLGGVSGGAVGAITGAVAPTPIDDANARIQAAGEEAAATGGDALDQAMARGNAQTDVTPDAVSQMKSRQTAADLGVEFQAEPQNWAQYDAPASARNDQRSAGPVTDIDRMIRSAEQLGFDDETVRLNTAKRFFSKADEVRRGGDEIAAVRLAEKGNAIVRDVMEQPELARADYFPAPFVSEGEILGGGIVPSQADPEQSGHTIDGQHPPEAVGANQARLLSQKAPDNRLTDGGIIYGQEPEEVTAQRDQRQANHFSAMYGQEGNTPLQSDPAIEGDLLPRGLVTEPERMLEDQSAQQGLLPDQSMAQLPPGENVIYGKQDRPERKFTPVDPLYDGIGRNIVERQAQRPPGLEHKPTITSQQFSQLEAQYRQVIRKPVSKRTDEEVAAVELVKQVRAGDVDIGSVAPNSLPDADKTVAAQQDQPVPQLDGNKHERIEDFGETLHGARKHIASFEKAVSADLDAKAVPLSKSFPQPDYAKLSASGIDKRALAAIAHVRARIGSKPRSAYKVSRWAEQVDVARRITQTLLSSDTDVDHVLERMGSQGAVEGSKLFPELLNIASDLDAGQIKQLGNYSLGKRHFHLFHDEKNVNKYAVTDVTKKAGFGNMGQESYFDTLDEAKAFVRQKVAGPVAGSAKTPKFDIWSKQGKEGVFIGKKIAARKYIELHQVPTVAEARAYIREHAEELTDQLKKKKQVRAIRRTDNSPRSGPDYRQGKDVTPDQFSEKFGFRGVQFGNWVEGDKRQQDLNEAYDGLLDLAQVIDVPPMALSLDGQLGLAFGARGRGGKQPAAAHYEPDTVVINLTKKSGAGSFAHEWWHAVDNYFARLEGAENSTYLTEHKRRGRVTKVIDGRPTFVKASDEDFSVRTEVYSAFQGVSSAIQNETRLAERSMRLDSGRTKDYWSTVREMTARTFERYVIGKLDAEGHSNDYLANIVSENDHATINEALGDSEAYAYPLASEMEAVNRAYDHLFETLDTRETDQGVALFSRGQATGSLSFDQVSEVADRLKKRFQLSGVTVRVVETETSLPADIIEQAEEEGATDQINAVLHGNEVFIVADRMASATAVEEAILHEGRHHGGRQLFGREFTAAYNKVWAKLGGIKGLRARAKEAGIADRMEPYFQTAADMIASGEITSSRRNEYLVDEFVAHVAGNQAYESMPARIKRAVQEFIGAIRQALRKAGFAELPELSNADLAYLVRQAGRAASGKKATKPHFMTVTEEDRMKLFLTDLAEQLESAPAMGRSDRSPLSRVPDDAPVLETDGDGIGSAESLKEMTANARAYAKQHFAGSVVRNVESGHEIMISMGGVRHTTQGAQPDLLKSVAVTPDILEFGKYLGSKPEAKNNQAIKAHHYYAVKLRIDGKLHDVVADVREMADGKRYYDHSFEAQKKEPESPASSHSRNPSSSEVDDTTPNPSIEGTSRFSRSTTSENFDDLNEDQAAFLNKIGPETTVQSLKRRFDEITDNWRLKVRQQLVDRYAPLYEVDKKARGEDVIEESIQDSSWVLARMAQSADGALNAMLNHGRIKYQGGVIDLQNGTKGLIDTLKKLGDSAEVERFMGWIAANRSKAIMDRAQAARDKAAELKSEKANLQQMLTEPDVSPGQIRSIKKFIKDTDRLIGIEQDKAAIDERLFTPEEVAAGIKLNKGQTANGKGRDELYTQVFDEFQQFRDDVLTIAKDAGIISEDNHSMWRDEFYVPFYRVMEDEEVKGPVVGGGLSRQQAYKKLKGGEQNLNDLLGNTLMNFNHLITASLKNQAAAKALENAEAIGAAEATTESRRDKKQSTFVLRGGKAHYYNVSDPLVYRALITMSDSAIKFPGMKLMRSFKRVFTNFTTASPQFIAANLIRDTLQAAATSEVSGNVAKNVYQGAKAYRIFNKDSRARAKMLASGGAFSFGHVYGEDADALKVQINGELRRASVIKDPAQALGVVRKIWEKYQDIGDGFENVNRAAVYEQNEDKGQLYAAFKSRDLMDFSQRGMNPVITFLIDTVPFLNARIQGLDKLYRSGAKPIAKVLSGKGTKADKQAAARFSVVTGALTLATMALYLMNKDDEDYRALEDWQKDSYWFVKVGDHAFFIPKPFEVGAIATMAERGLEQLIDDQAKPELFLERFGHMLSDTFSFNPVPHIARPLLDIKANKDQFTGRPIESMSMERLSPSLRSRTNTSDPAKWVSAGLESTVGAAFGNDSMGVLSPVQVDYLVRNYLGWLGERAVAVTDSTSKLARGFDEPTKEWHEYQPMRRFYRDLSKPQYTKYQTEFYEGLKEVNRLYADVRKLQELGQVDDAQAIIREHGSKLRLRKALAKRQRQLSMLTSRMKMIKQGGLPAETKRQRLDVLQQRKNQLVKVVHDLLNR